MLEPEVVVDSDEVDEGEDAEENGGVAEEDQDLLEDWPDETEVRLCLRPPPLLTK